MADTDKKTNVMGVVIGLAVTAAVIFVLAYSAGKGLKAAKA